MCGDNPRLTAERATFIAEHATLATEDGFGFVFAGDPRHRWINPVLYPLDEAKACWRRVSAPTLWVAGRDSVLMKPFAANPDDYRERMGCFAADTRCSGRFGRGSWRRAGLHLKTLRLHKA